MEERNKPTVTLVNHGFANDAGSASLGRGMPMLRYLPTSVPCEASILEDIEAGVSESTDAIVEALTKPLSAEEASPTPKAIEEPSRIIFKGDIEEVNRFFYRRGWTDGLPIIPPTEGAVAEMLTGTDLLPDHLLGKLISRLGKATIEKIAINAVMAGALPTYMPVLIAGTKLLLESEPGFLGFGTFGFSTGSWSPFWIINGPLRKDLHIKALTEVPEIRARWADIKGSDPTQADVEYDIRSHLMAGFIDLIFNPAVLKALDKTSFLFNEFH